MLDVASYNEEIEREKRLKRLGMFFLSLCALLFIAAVVYLAVQCGYVGTARFTAFCVSATVYLLCMWVVYPSCGARHPLCALIRRPSTAVAHSLRHWDAAMCYSDVFTSAPRGQASVTRSCPCSSYPSFPPDATTCRGRERASSPSTPRSIPPCP